MRRFVITEQLDGSWLLVESDDHGNVWPTTEKRSAREIVARLSQLLGIGPVAPQTHAEIVELGESDLADDAPPLESLLAISEPPAAPTERCRKCGRPMDNIGGSATPATNGGTICTTDWRCDYCDVELQTTHFAPPKGNNGD